MKRNYLLIAILILAAALRLIALDRYPAGLNADEASLGYNAYSLIETGRDEHNTPFPLEFRSFDDYKPGIYVYLTLPFVFFFGLNEWAVRLPSALLGILSVYLIYLLTNSLFNHLKFRPLKFSNFTFNLGHFTALLLSLSPWHLHFSRGGWEVNTATSIILLGLVFFFKSFKKPSFLILTSLTFVLSLYTYHASRIVVPLLFLSLTVIYLKELLNLLRSKSSRNYLLLSILIGIILVLPLAFQFLSGSATSRFSGVGLFADPGPLSWVHEMRRLSPDPDSVLTKLRFNRYSAYAFEFLKNYLSHFSPIFLYFKGDEIARSKVPGFGQNLHLLLPFFYLGLIALILKLRQNSSKLILSWLLIAPIAASLTFQSPHALRSQNLVIPLTITTSIGLIAFFTWLRKQLGRFLLTVFAFILFLGLTANFGYYLNSYYSRYPKELPFAWQYGFRELGNYLLKNQDRYQKIIISTAYDQPYILTAFFLKYPPLDLQKELVFSTPDRFGFSTGLAFGKYEFHPIDWQTDFQPDTLLVVADESVPPEITPVLIIPYPNGKPAFRLYDTNQYIVKK